MAAALFLVTAGVFWPARHYPFISIDDPLYVTGNTIVSAGLTATGLGWALTTFHAANWHPLTWISHMVDVELFGLVPGGHHLVSVLLHALSAALLFRVLWGMTGSVGRSAAAATLFGIHPLRVESVAWIAERKDVLSSLFWILALLAYLRWVQLPSRRRYLGALAAFALGLLSKPMIITLPFVLLLLDFWPLNRLRLSARGCASPCASPGVPLSRLILEKVPFLLLAGASAMVTFVAQQGGGAVGSVADYPLPLRVGNALIAYVRYLQMTLWPRGLAMLYLYPEHGLPTAEWLFAGVLLGVLTGYCAWFAARRPALAVGWFWYLGTLVPVIGLVQAGLQSRADRYTYIPHVGLFLAGAWGVRALPRAWPVGWKRALAGGAAVVLLALTLATRTQLAAWKTNKSLFEHAVSVNPDNWVVRTEFGLILAEEGQLLEGIEHYRAALRANPDYRLTHFNLGVALNALGRVEEAVQAYATALRLSPSFAEAHHNLGVIELQQGRLAEAYAHFDAAARAQPGYADAHHSLGAVLLQQGNDREALKHLEQAFQLEPGNTTFRDDFARVRDHLLGRRRGSARGQSGQTSSGQAFPPP